MSDVKWGGKSARTEDAKDQKRRMLLKTAAQMFNEVGYERTSLTDIAIQFGITKPSLYHYIKNKEDILVSISNAALDDLKQALKTTRAGHVGGRDQLVAFLTEYIKLIQTDFGKCLVTSSKMVFSEDNRQTFQENKRTIDHDVRDIINTGVVDGSLATSSSKISTFAIFGAIHWMCFWHKDGDELSNEEIVEQFIEFFLKGLEPRGFEPKKLEAKSLERKGFESNELE